MQASSIPTFSIDSRVSKLLVVRNFFLNSRLLLGTFWGLGVRVSVAVKICRCSDGWIVL